MQQIKRILRIHVNLDIDTEEGGESFRINSNIFIQPKRAGQRKTKDIISSRDITNAKRILDKQIRKFLKERGVKVVGYRKD